MSTYANRVRNVGRRAALSWVVAVAVGVVVGLLIAPGVGPSVGVVSEPTPDTVAVVPLEGGIDGQVSADVSASLAAARQDPSIEAVVLVSNSPGGGAAASERLYLETARTAEEMPVVASVDAMAASGAYYAVVAADYIYAKPSSQVGSVGVLANAPQQIQPIDQIIATGPDKLSGGSDRDWIHNIESLRRAFVGAVYQQRGDRLSIDRTELSEAGLYTGGDAVANGMVDEIGGLTDAIKRAAADAELSNYRVTVLRDENTTAQFLARTNYVASGAEHKRMVSPRSFVGEPGDAAAMNILMLPPSVVAASIEEAPANASTPDERAEVNA
jgi:protease-4